MWHSRRFIYALTALGLLGVVAVYAFQAVQANIAPSIDLLMGEPVLQVISMYLLIFLAVLFVRYGVLMLYSFLEHLEHLKGQARHVEPADATFPMVSLVVPAYNEGPVIEAAIASLLVLDYPTQGWHQLLHPLVHAL